MAYFFLGDYCILHAQVSQDELHCYPAVKVMDLKLVCTFLKRHLCSMRRFLGVKSTATNWPALRECG
eukprot:92032-Pelagomonas_calceolata.AAC.1